MVRIYHNSHCSKSRATLALLEERDLEIEVINYLDTPPNATELADLLGKLGMGARDLLRTGPTAIRRKPAWLASAFCIRQEAARQGDSWKSMSLPNHRRGADILTG